MVTSEEAGIDKPDKIPFELAVNKLQVAPKNIWMIGDNPISDIEGGKNAGMYTIQIINSGEAVSVNSDMHCNDYRTLITNIIYS